MSDETFSVTGGGHFRAGDVVRTSLGEEVRVTSVAASSMGFGWDHKTGEPWAERDGVRLEGEDMVAVLASFREALGTSVFEMVLANARIPS